MKRSLLTLALVLLAATAANATSAYDTAVLATSGLVGYWSLDNNTNDTSGNGNDGVATDITYETGGGADGLKAAIFNGTTSKILLPIPKPTGIPPLTIEFAAQPEVSNVVGVFDSAPLGQFSVRNYGANNLEWWPDAPDVPWSPAVNTWNLYQIIYTYSSGQRHVTVCTNGSCAAATNVTSPYSTIGWFADALSNPQDFIVGAINNGAAGYFKGDIAKFAIYNVALTPGQVLAHWTAYVPSAPAATVKPTPAAGTAYDDVVLAETGLVGFWPFNGSLADASVGGNDAVALAGATINAGSYVAGGGNDGEKALTFNGSTTKVKLPLAKPAPYPPITFEFAVYPKAGFSPIGIFDSAPCGQRTLRNYGTNIFEWHQDAPDAPFTLPAGQWSLVQVMFWNPGATGARNITVCINGTCQTPVPGTNPYFKQYGWGSDTGQCWSPYLNNYETGITGPILGAINDGPAGFFTGWLAKFAIYTKQLTKTDVDRHWQAYIAGASGATPTATPTRTPTPTPTPTFTPSPSKVATSTQTAIPTAIQTNTPPLGGVLKMNWTSSYGPTDLWWSASGAPTDFTRQMTNQQNWTCTPVSLLVTRGAGVRPGASVGLGTETLNPPYGTITGGNTAGQILRRYHTTWNDSGTVKNVDYDLYCTYQVVGNELRMDFKISNNSSAGVYFENIGVRGPALISAGLDVTVNHFGQCAVPPCFGRSLTARHSRSGQEGPSVFPLLYSAPTTPAHLLVIDGLYADPVAISMAHPASGEAVGVYVPTVNHEVFASLLPKTITQYAPWREIELTLPDKPLFAGPPGQETLSTDIAPASSTHHQLVYSWQRTTDTVISAPTMRNLANGFANGFPMRIAKLPAGDTSHPIGTLFLAAHGPCFNSTNGPGACSVYTAPMGYNPFQVRNWNWDAMHNITGIDYRNCVAQGQDSATQEDYHTRFMQFAGTVLQGLIAMNARGVIVWDAIGAEFGTQSMGYQAVGTSNGSFPSISISPAGSDGWQNVVEGGFSTALPCEMAYKSIYAPDLQSQRSIRQSTIDDFFSVFTNSGYQVGTMITPASITLTGGNLWTRTNPTNPSPPTSINLSTVQSSMADKINLQSNAWGAKLFYVDSFTADFNNIKASSLSIIANQGGSKPDILMMPENKSLVSFAYIEPYNEGRDLDNGYPFMDVFPKEAWPDDQARWIYPNARGWDTINLLVEGNLITPTDPCGTADGQKLVRQVELGDGVLVTPDVSSVDARAYVQATRNVYACAHRPLSPTDQCPRACPAP